MSMRAFLAAVMLLVSIPTAGAHIGNENNTEIRVYQDSMRVVLRTSIRFAWMVLGADAPPTADESGQAIAKPLLIAAAPELLTIIAGDKPLSPTQVDCMFEVMDDVAFVFSFERPVDWPVVVKMKFFNRLANLDDGTIAVFDYSASRFARDVEPLAQKIVNRDDTSLTFTLGMPKVAADPDRHVPTPHRKAETTKHHVKFVFLLVGVVTVWLLVYRRKKVR